MQQIIQIIDMVKTLFSTFFVGWNIPASLLIVAATVVGVRLGTKYSIKRRFQRHKRKYRKRLNKIESNLKNYSKTKNPKNLKTNLIAKEKLRIKAAKKGIALKNEVALNHITFAQPRISKEDEKAIRKDAKLNLLRLRNSKKAFDYAEKHTLNKDAELSFETEDFLQIANQINSDEFGAVPLTLDSITASKRHPVLIEQSVRNYKKDLSATKFEKEQIDRKKSLQNHPLVMELEDENKEPIIRISDTVPERFYNYGTDSFAYLYNLVSENLKVPTSEMKEYKITFYDTGSQRKVQQMHTPITTLTDLETFITNFNDNFYKVKTKKSKNKEKVKKNKVEIISLEDIKKRAEELKYFQKVEQSTEKDKNSFTYAKSFSKNLKSPALENGFKELIKQNTYTDYDPEPQTTTLLIDGKEVFRVRVESKDLFDLTDEIVDAYIAGLMSKRMIEIGKIGEVTKVIEGTHINQNNMSSTQIAKNRAFVRREEKIKNIEYLFDRHGHKGMFFAAFTAVAKDLQFAISDSFARAAGLGLSGNQHATLDKNLEQFEIEYDNKALELFGVLPNKEERKKVEYPTVSENPSGFKAIKDLFEPGTVMKAPHLKGAIDGAIYNKKTKQSITTTIPKLEENFEEDIKLKDTNFEGLPHTVDILYEGDKKAKVFFKLGATVYNNEVFKEYFYKILAESLYLIEGSEDKNLSTKTPLEVYIAIVNNEKEKTTIQKFTSIHQLRKELSTMRNEYKYMDLEAFKNKYINNTGEGQNM